MIGYALCGSFCTFSKSLEQLKLLKERGLDIIPIMSENAISTDTRFGSAAAFAENVMELCGREIIHTIKDAEPLGPQIELSALIISPCTGNTLAKIANGITDTTVTMAAKAHLRSDRPLIIALASNDALSANLRNIGTLLSRKQVYFVPMEQDDPEKKPHSLVCDFSLLGETFDMATKGKQLRKIFI
ncbi:MAG: dipicolinate synthase subunit B [Clostridia bacterium]|nr:dipicolinate synthase subunit B [Clostridia bacterium]